MKCFPAILSVSCVFAFSAEELTERDVLQPERQKALDNLLAGRFSWGVSAPLVSPVSRPQDPCHSVKDPTIVRYKDRRHLFCTIRSQKRSHQIEYLSFDDWENARQLINENRMTNAIVLPPRYPAPL